MSATSFFASDRPLACSNASGGWQASIGRVTLWTFGYAGAAALTDWLLGTNYGFFRAKPGHATFYDLLPAWPYYIPVTIGIGIACIFVLYAPWWIADGLNEKRVRPA